MRKSSVSKQSKHSSCSAVGQRPRIGEAARELLVPARDQRRAVGDALRGRARLGRHLVVGTTRVTRPFSFASVRVEDPALEQDLERDRGPDQAHQRRHLGVRHHQAEVLDRRAEAARFAADAQIAQRRDLEAAADADAVDLRDQRMAAARERIARCVHDAAVLDRLRLVRALGRELADVVARRERFLAGAAHDHAAQRRRRPTVARSPRRARATSPRVSAFSFSGRLRTTVAIAPSRSTSIDLRTVQLLNPT